MSAEERQRGDSIFLHMSIRYMETTDYYIKI